MDYKELYFKEAKRVAELQRMLSEYQQDNWNLNQKICEADKQIQECLKDLAFCKNYLVEFKKEYDIMENRCKTLMACMPKKNKEIINEVLNASSK